MLLIVEFYQCAVAALVTSEVLFHTELLFQSSQWHHTIIT